MTFEGTIRLNLDRRGYAEKPGAYVGAIRNRLCTAASIRDLTVDQLMDAIQRGYTFTPAAMAGTTGDTWQGQQVICADLDNDTGRKDGDGNKIMLEPPLTPDEARAIMRGHGINPCFMYFTLEYEKPVALGNASRISKANCLTTLSPQRDSALRTTRSRPMPQ